MLTFKDNKKDPILIDANKIILSIGVIAVLLPLIVHLAAFPLKDCVHGKMHSISAYYHTDAQDILVGLICALAFSFLAYNGHSKTDMIFSKIAAFSALGVALIPTSIFEGEYVCIGPDGSCIREYIHLACAVILLLTMAVFSLFIFTHREEGVPIHPRKKFFYRFYGITILVSLGLIAVYVIFLKDIYPDLSNKQPIFWLESICLVAFGSSWLLKSKLFDSKKKGENGKTENSEGEVSKS